MSSPTGRVRYDPTLVCSKPNSWKFHLSCIYLFTLLDVLPLYHSWGAIVEFFSKFSSSKVKICRVVSCTRHFYKTKMIWPPTPPKSSFVWFQKKIIWLPNPLQSKLALLRIFLPKQILDYLVTNFSSTSTSSSTYAYLDNRYIAMLPLVCRVSQCNTLLPSLHPTLPLTKEGTSIFSNTTSLCSRMTFTIQWVFIWSS